MRKLKQLQLLKLSSLSLLIGMAGCTNSALCHLQWYPVTTDATTWTLQDTLTIPIPLNLQAPLTHGTCKWHLEATGRAACPLRTIQLLVGLQTKDTVYWEKIDLKADTTLLTTIRQETFGRLLWTQRHGQLVHTKNIEDHPQDSLRHLLVLPRTDSLAISDIGLNVLRQAVEK